MPLKSCFFIPRHNTIVRVAQFTETVRISLKLFFPLNHLEKRKASMEDMEQQPPPKRMEIDGPIFTPSSNSPPSQLPGETAALANSGASSTSSHTPVEIVSASRGTKNNGSGHYLNTSSILAQVWKDDLDSGHLLVSLFELFGESILPFIPSPEMSLFL